MSQDNNLPPDDRRCTATSTTTGERCKKWAIRGGTVCRTHGGAAPQVKQKAQERLDRMADSVTMDVQEILDDLAEEYDEADLEEKLAIQSAVKSHWRIILDRTGHGPTEKREVMGEGGGPVGVVFDETLEAEQEGDDGDG